VFDPRSAFLRVAAELGGVWGVAPLHHHSLEELAAQVGVDGFEAEVEAHCGVGFVADGRGEQEGVFRERLPLAGREALGFNEAGKQLPALFIRGGAAGGNKIEQDEASAPDLVAAFERFAVGPEDAALGEQAQLVKGGGEPGFDGKSAAVAVPHGSRGHMNECPPAVVFGLCEPQPRLSGGQFELSAADWPGGE
jgi:hypothetical protein